MYCSTINELPLSLLDNNNDWPWRDSSPRLLERMSDGSPWPKISIVTPSFNQGQFIEETIRSILLQNYSNLEYIIIDGGSTDNTVDIIKKYEKQLSYWVSEPDNGQYDAINKGFSKATGEILTWLNADDKYTPWALHVVGNIFSTLSEIEWITTLCPILWNSIGLPIKCYHIDGFSRQGFLKGENLPGGVQYFKGPIQQESTFWRNSLWNRTGGYIDSSFNLAADFELWSRFYQHAELFGIPVPLGGFRFHHNQKTSHYFNQYIQEAIKILKKYGGQPCGKFESFFRNRLAPHIPIRFHRLAVYLGLYYIHYKCVYSGCDGRWEIVKQ